MPSVPTGRTINAAPSDLNNHDQVFASSSPHITTRRLHSQKSVGTEEQEFLGNFDEVTFLRLPEVKEITGLSKSSLYAQIQEKRFSPPVLLGVRTVAWVRSEVRQPALAVKFQ